MTDYSGYACFQVVMCRHNQRMLIRDWLLYGFYVKRPNGSRFPASELTYAHHR